MKRDFDYLRALLHAFREAPGPTTDIRELKAAGLDYEDPRFEFHMLLLADDGYVEAESSRGGIGLDKAADGAVMWSVVPLRLTASGQEFADALSSNEAVKTIKSKFLGASLTTIKDVAVAVFKAEVLRHTGLTPP